MYPKDERKPIVFAYDDMDISNITFHRPNDKSLWDKAEIYPTHPNNSPYQRFLPDFTEANFLKLHLKFKKSWLEQEKDADPNNSATHTIHMYEYLYKAKDGVDLIVRFRVSDSMFKTEAAYPKHFDAIFVAKNS